MAGPEGFFGVAVSGGPGPADPAEILEVFEVLRPKPSALPLVRIGGDGDGGYLVPDDLEGITACFSPGVNNVKTFEDFLTDTHGITCHMCDFSSDPARFRTPLREGLQTFRKQWLDPAPGPDNLSLESWVSELAPEGDLLLQMDIEGAEYRNLLATPAEVLARFRVIVLEVHRMGELTNEAVLRSVLAPFFRKLGADFTCVHAHPNNCCGEFTAAPGVRVPHVLELTFLRNDRFRPAEGVPLIPHPHDISRNVLATPPLFLGEEWLGGERPLASKVKVLEDKMAYAEWLRTAPPKPPVKPEIAKPAPLTGLARVRAGVRWRVRRLVRKVKRALPTPTRRPST